MIDVNFKKISSLLGSRLRKCAALFGFLLLFLAVTGLIFQDHLAVITGSQNIVAERTLIPGGQSIGLQMKVQGALIVGVENQSGPQVGDMIVRLNGEKVNGPADVQRLVADSKKPVRLGVIRNNRSLEYEVTPYLDQETNEYRLGFWIKERIAGIGTLTFYDPESGGFAALGHGIYEAETGILLASKDGSLLRTRVNQIKAGEKGKPGEIGGMIYDFKTPLGSIVKNTEFGIYGKADESEDFDLRNPMVVAPPEEAQEGKAMILTTIDGTAVESFEIQITGVRHQHKAEGKGIEFEVTDQRLLDACGGIIQGMSGSPIIQNNKIIGAVTHVFVNDPKKGYGIFAQWMVEEMDK